MGAINYHMQFEELIETYLADGLTGKERSEFEQHNTVCETCRKSLVEARRFTQMVLQTLMPNRSPEGLEGRIVDAFYSAYPQTVAKRNMGIKLLHWAVIPTAAIVLIIIGMMVMVVPKFTGSVSEAKKAVIRQSGASATIGDKAMERVYLPKVAAAISDDHSDKMRLDTTDSIEVFETESSFKEAGVYDTIGIGGGLGGNSPTPLAADEPQRDMKVKEQQKLTAGEPLNPDRKIIKSGMLTFEVDSFETAYQKVVAILTEEKGYVASSSTTKLPNGKVRGQIIIRVLPERFDNVTLKLRSLGELKNQQVTSEDITKQYIDLTARVKNAKALEERLIKLMNEKEGKIKDLLEVEKELANTREKIERIQGEIKYYDNLTSLATITLDITEKDISKPFEYVQTQSSNMTVAVSDVDVAYKKAQGIVHSLKGQIVEGAIADQDKRLNGIIKAYVDAEQFAGLLEQLKALGEVKYFNATQKQTSSEGTQTPADNAPVRKERGLVVLSLTPPQGEYIQTKHAQIILEVADVDSIYSKAQTIATDAQAKILNGTINRGTDQTVANLVCQVESERFRSLMDNLKTIGKVKSATMNEKQQAQGIDPKSALQAPVRKDPGVIELIINSPSAIVTSEHGIGATLKDTLKGSISGLLWSLEMLIVGLMSVAPWVVVTILVYILYRRLTRRSKTTN